MAVLMIAENQFIENFPTKKTEKAKKKYEIVGKGLKKTWPNV